MPREPLPRRFKMKVSSIFSKTEKPNLVIKIMEMMKMVMKKLALKYK
jgi:hypothetical protein